MGRLPTMSAKSSPRAWPEDAEKSSDVEITINESAVCGPVNDAADNALVEGCLHLIVPTVLMLAACFLTADGAGEDKDVDLSDAPYIAGSLLYTLTGLWNVLSLRSDPDLAPGMVYTNSIMSFSALFFGPAQLAIYFSPLHFVLKYGEWYCIPNFGWGVEWGLQLLGDTGSGLRALVIMSLSIASYGLKFLFEGGFLVAFLPQVVAAIVMCVWCFRRYNGPEAAWALGFWVSACLVFLILHEVEYLLPTTWHQHEAFEPTRSFVTKACDCTQTHFSIRFFVAMFRQKHTTTMASDFEGADEKPGTPTKSDADDCTGCVGECP